MKKVARILINSVTTVIFLVALNYPAGDAIAAIVIFDTFLLVQEELIGEFRR